MLSGKRVLIGITGAIAAYKSLELIRMYKRANADVKVVMTPNALQFVTKLTLQTLSQNPVYVEMFNVDNWCPEHISLTDSDILVIAPCTANTLAKISHGIADNLLTSTALAFKNPVLIAPSMNTGMWDDVITQENIKNLVSKGYEIIEPEIGFLACGEEGKGRLPKIETIFEKSIEILNKKKILTGKKVVITSGGTREKIDAVRYITNNSSGKMGEALADFAFKNGASVTFVSTKKVEKPYEVLNVNSADEMFETVKTLDYDCILMAAAVGDFKVKEISEQKIKKNDEGLTLELVQNPDILQFLSKNKKENQIVVGFCAESENLIDNAKIKIAKKGCDYLIANDISRKDIGFDSDNNEVYILDKNLNITKVEKSSKKVIAQKIWEYIYGEN